jgi:hypothetical protein
VATTAFKIYLEIAKKKRERDFLGIGKRQCEKNTKSLKRNYADKKKKEDLIGLRD